MHHNGLCVRKSFFWWTTKDSTLRHSICAVHFLSCLSAAQFSVRKARTAKAALRITPRFWYAEILNGRHIHLCDSLTKLAALRAARFVRTLLGGWE